jgi:hypothetical protein
VTAVTISTKINHDLSTIPNLAMISHPIKADEKRPSGLTQDCGINYAKTTDEHND